VYNGSTWINTSAAGSVVSYNHIQSTASATWNIAHNLGTTNLTYNFSVYISSVLTPIFPAAIVFTDANNIVVTFSQTYTGVATLVGAL
jgi:hypothetical protein